MSSDSRDGIVGVAASLMCLSTIAVGLRFYARKQQKARFLADDWLVIPALITYIAAAIVVFIAHEEKTLGYTFSEFSPEEQLELTPKSSKAQIAIDILGIVSPACVKLSALFFYRRVFCVGGPVNNWFNIATKVFIVLVCLWSAVFCFLTGFQCNTAGIQALWNGTYLEYCTISFPFLYGLTLSDFILDVFILALPVPLVWQLHATRAKKLSISGIFLLAFVGLGASIARVVIIVQDEEGGPTYYATHDQERINTSYLFFVMLENGMSLIAVQLPSLWLLCTSVIPDKLARSARSMISLFSLNSRGSGSRSTHDRGNTFDDAVALEKGRAASSSAQSGATDEYLVAPASSTAFRSDLDESSFQSYAMREGVQETRMAVPKSGIHVQHTVELSRD